LIARTNFIAVRIAIALSIAGFFAAAAHAQDTETIDAPHYHSAYVSKGQTSLDYFAFDAQGKRIIEKESNTAVL
jgi:hypothetical protein